MNRFESVFPEGKAILGMVHLLPLPGSGGFNGDMDAIYERALHDAKALEEGGVSALIIENASDMPFSKTLSLEQSVALGSVAAVVKQKTNLPIGIVATFCDYKAALAAAKAAKADFVRLAVFVDTVVNFAGVMEPCCADAIRYRKQIQAEEVMIFADVQVKYSHMLLPHISIEESAQYAVKCGADAIIVTGSETGQETPIDAVKRVRNVVNSPIIVGSGISPANIKEQMKYAEGAIVGSSLKKDDVYTNGVDIGKVKELMGELNVGLTEGEYAT